MLSTAGPMRIEQEPPCVNLQNATTRVSAQKTRTMMQIFTPAGTRVGASTRNMQHDAGQCENRL
ncbi:hypothetical protein HW555_000129 [Spodoptera exigua]|uniref:Uncharacterized protein n=1 Tax=Spodoptera exigua TaxID=7107 RepID=A0A835GWP1_SPOEX|nr:hypothetical protein HW555_000129 [Spodoptera exigua]